MLKKILIISLTLSMYMYANSNSNIDCESEFEQCANICSNTESSDSESACIEKCDLKYDKCVLLLNNLENIEDSDKESTEELDESLHKIQLELDKKQQQDK